MLELDKKVFGKITTKEIIGAEPPAIPDTKDILEKELGILLVELESQSKENLDGRYSLFAAVGFCGSLTTMSAFALDSSNLLENNHYGILVINVIANVGLSIAALIGGKSLMSAIISH